MKFFNDATTLRKYCINILYYIFIIYIFISIIRKTTFSLYYYIKKCRVRYRIAPLMILDQLVAQSTVSHDRFKQYVIPSLKFKQMEVTLAIIKPHIVRNTPAFNRLLNNIKDNFRILDSKEVLITKHIFDKFYGEHKGKFFYNRLSTFMGSGPSFALILESNNCISKWREMMGPTRVFKAIYSHPFSIRGLYGLSDTRNVCHGSDSEESAAREISILFPDFNKHKIEENSS